MCSDKHIVALIPSKVKLMIVKIVFSASQFKVDSHISICRLYMLLKPGIHDIQVLHPSLHSSFLNSSFLMCIPYKKLESKNLNELGWNRNASYFSFNLDGTWMEIDQSEDRILISINL